MKDTYEVTEKIQVPERSCYLIKATRADEPFLRKMVQDPTIMQHQGGTLSSEQVDAFINFVFAHLDKHGFGHFLLRLESGETIGVLSLKQMGTQDSKEHDLGFMVLEEFRHTWLRNSCCKSIS